MPATPTVTFAPRLMMATAFGDAAPDGAPVVGHRFTLDGVARLDGPWQTLIGPSAAGVAKDLRFPRPGKILKAWAELVTEWDSYWEELAGMFPSVATTGGGIPDAARDATAAVTYSPIRLEPGPDLVIALRMRAVDLQQLGPWWQHAVQSKTSRLRVEVTGLRFSLPEGGIVSSSPTGTSVPAFMRGVPVFAAGYGFSTHVSSRRS